MRKLFVLLLLLFAALSLTAYADEITKGDYIEFGTYNGEPIVWRCIETEDGKALMISDSIITLKAFDAAGDTENDAYGRRKINGSNLWGNSAIRSWLNSDSDSVFYHDTLPDAWNVTENPYSTERGFLKYFSEAEKELILSSEITTVINACDLSYASSGSTEHILNPKITQAVSNYSESYIQTTTDKFFLPSVNDICNIASDVYTFLPLYEIAYPTDEAVMYSELKFADLDVNSSWGYWLRDAVSYARNNDLVRIVTKNGTVDYDSAYNGVMGVRPMFYIDTENAAFTGGNGDSSEPYSVRSGKWVEITDGDFAAEANESFALNLCSAGVDECEFKVTVNGNEIDAPYDDISLPGGIYTIGIKAVSDGETVAVSDCVTVTVIEYTVDNLMLDNGFEGSNPYEGFAGHGTEGGSFEVVNENGGHSLKLTSQPEDYSGGTAPYLILPNVPSDTEVIMIEADMKFAKDVSYSMLPLKFKTTNTWLNMVSYTPTGLIVFTDCSGNKTVLKDDVGLDEWHNYKLVYNIKESAATFFIDNKAYLVNEPVGFNEFNLNYCNINSSSKGNVMYVDNVSQKVIGDNPVYRVSYEKNGTGIFYTDCENGREDFRYSGENTGKISQITDDEAHGSVLKLTTVGIADNAPYLLSPYLSGLSNEILVQADYKFPDAGKMSGSLLSVKTLPDSKWLTLLAINTAGEIVLKGTTGSEKVVMESVDPDKWYSMRIIFNKSEATATVSINDEVYTKVNLSYTQYTDFDYLNINPGTLYSESEASVLVDNVRISHSERFVSPYETNVIKVIDPCGILSGYKLITGAYKGNRLTAVEITEITSSGEYLAELEEANGDETLKTFIVEDIESLKSVPMMSK